jgi:hypothetical protein
MTDRSSTPQQDEIYVGYLPVPLRQRKFLLLTVPLLLWVLCAGAFLWARSQHAPGPAVWDDAGQPIRLRGVIVSKPYPLLFTLDAEGTPQAILLVEAGKHGSHQRFTGLDGRSVTVSGWPLHRDGRRMLELEPSESAVVADASTPPTPVPTVIPVGRVTLRGEIVDSKCFLGAMKPGEGKTHKECATLCIRGGIPPMFVTRNAEGVTTYYLLENPAGGPLDAAIFPFIADPVEVRGEHAEWGRLNILRVKPEDVRRL